MTTGDIRHHRTSTHLGGPSSATKAPRELLMTIVAGILDVQMMLIEVTTCLLNRRVACHGVQLIDTNGRTTSNVPTKLTNSTHVLRRSIAKHQR